jgi:ElaB/YqjD/DUF883 family membrane-anchored ribosome-binding protein
MRGVRMEQLGDVIEEKRDEFRANTAAVMETLREKVDDVPRMARRAQRKADDLAEEVRHEIKESPFTAVAIGATAGALIGATVGMLVGFNWKKGCKG